mmetsp:Transcript_15923/g.28867  ORF Transcript_15923/g.28867 Transcript_15923/m.28867 type:complete len:287 (+) Transcript_15923:149-1009(+)
MSKSAVIPILTSIVRASSNSLKHLQLPKKFRNKPSPMLDKFLGKYSQLLEKRKSQCSKCARYIKDWQWSLDDDDDNDEEFDEFNDYSPWVFNDEGHRYYGLQTYTCSKCVQHFCKRCEDTVICTTCEKEYCSNCASTAECGNCIQVKCSGCIEVAECTDCGENICEDCNGECYCCGKICCNGCDTLSFKVCEGEDCGKQICHDCVYRSDRDVGYCCRCRETLCSSCRVFQCSRDLTNACTDCVVKTWGRLAPKLQENQEEKEKVCLENEVLRQEIKELKEKCQQNG